MLPLGYHETEHRKTLKIKNEHAIINCHMLGSHFQSKNSIWSYTSIKYDNIWQRLAGKTIYWKISCRKYVYTNISITWIVDYLKSFCNSNGKYSIECMGIGFIPYFFVYVNLFIMHLNKFVRHLFSWTMQFSKR
jgi:hypothetical protein